MVDGVNARDAHYLDEAFSRLEICDDTRELIAGSHREIEFDLTLELGDGERASFRGYRVQHDRSLGPFKGGLRYHPEVGREHLRELAASMSWKTALNDLPLGGAKGGVTCDPRAATGEGVALATSLAAERQGIDLEGANLPVTAGGSRALEARDIAVIPDVMANAGGVIVSYLEWVQNRQGLRWSAGQVTDSMEQRMRSAWKALCDVADSDDCGYRQAAFNIAVERINTAIALRGV